MTFAFDIDMLKRVLIYKHDDLQHLILKITEKLTIEKIF